MLVKFTALHNIIYVANKPFKLNVIMLNVGMLNVGMLNVGMLNVGMLSVVAPLPGKTR
jgi:hypothetical protein